MNNRDSSPLDYDREIVEAAEAWLNDDRNLLNGIEECSELARLIVAIQAKRAAARPPRTPEEAIKRRLGWGGAAIGPIVDALREAGMLKEGL